MEPIAIIGIGCRFPGGIKDTETFWQVLIDGIDTISEVPPDRFDINAFYDPEPQTPGKIVTRCGGFIDDVDKFDADFFAIAPREANNMDPQQRLLAEVAWEAFEDAGIRYEELAGRKTGVYVGIFSNDYELSMFEHLPGINFYSATGGAHYSAAGRLSYLFDLRGPSLTVETACSSSLVAVHLACQSLRLGESETAIAGGVNLILTPHMSIALSNGRVLSPEGRCKFGDASANGYARSEGCGMIVLKALSRAIEDNDRVYACILGSAINNDGRNGLLVAPSISGQIAVQREAYCNSGIHPKQVSFIEAHGTGTAVGDPVEMRALGEVIGAHRLPGNPCPVGSLKTNIGHGETASGVAGLIKAALCLRYRKIPPSLHFKTPNPEIPWNELNLRIVTEPSDVPKDDQPAVAGVNSFGLTGMNAHIVLQEYPWNDQERRSGVISTTQSSRAFLLPLSAKSRPSLAQAVKQWRDFLTTRDPGSTSLYDLSYTAGLRRTHHDYRHALVGRSIAEFAEKLDLLQRETSGLEDIQDKKQIGDENRLVYVFSGQGPQWFAMGRQLLEQEPIYRQMIARCSELLEGYATWSLLDELRADESASRMNQTEIAQPAIFALQMGLTALWRSWGIVPDAVVGHSVGEVAAACFSGILSLEDAVRVVYHRGRLLQQVTGKGRMAAVELAPEVAEAIVGRYPGQLNVAAVNGPTSVTLSGETAALQEVLESLKERNLFCRMLPVNYAFHSHQIEPYKQEMICSVEGIRIGPAAIPIFSTVYGKPAAAGDFGAAYWAENIRRPVLFAPVIDKLIQGGHRTFLELSPHPVLGLAISQCLAGHQLKGTLLASLRRQGDEKGTMLDSLAALYVQGRSIAWKALYPEKGRCITLPTYPWHKKPYWIQRDQRPNGAGSGKQTQSRLKPVIGERQVNSHEDNLWGLLMHVGWHPQRRLESPVPRRIPSYLPSPKKIGERLEDVLLGPAGGGKAGILGDASPHFDQLSASFILAAFRELSWNMGEDDSGTTEQLMARLGILAKHHRLFERLLEILAQEGVLKQTGPLWKVVHVPLDQDWSLKWSEMAAAYPELKNELILFKRCGQSLARVLTGNQDPLELLFPPEADASAEILYESSSISLLPNEMIKRTVSYATEKLGPDRVLRILEIGAGTGGTTSHLLNTLPTGRTEYIFSDVSNLFLERARMKFGGYPFMRFQLLDIEQDPEAQGVAPHQFDMIIASNVLHATADLRKALRRIYRLLVPNGLMLLVEGVRPTRWIDLIFGQLEGWWKFKDLDLRPSSPLLSEIKWNQLLHELPFAELNIRLAINGQAGKLFEQAFIVAQAQSVPIPMPPVSVGPRGVWLILADNSGVGQCLAEHLRARGETCVLVYEGAEFMDRGSEVWINPLRPEEYQRMLDAVRNRCALPTRAIVHLWSLNQETSDWMSSAEGLENSVRHICAGALGVLHAIADGSRSGKPRLWLVTRGAQSVGDRDPLRHVNQSPIWGIGRTAANEYPDFWGGLVDLDPSGEPGETAAILLDSILHPDMDGQFAIRGGERYVPRLLPLPRREERPLTIRGDGTYLLTGGLGDLGLEVARWLADQGARRLILLSRTPLPPTDEWRRIGPERKEYRQIAAIREMQTAGVEIQTASVDVSNESQLRAFLEGIRDKGGFPIRGVIHTAAQFETRLLQHQDAETFTSGLRTKVIGAWLLDRYLGEEPLDFFLEYSSLNALFGLIGLGSYAAANVFLDAMASYRRGSGKPALSVNWGLWSGYGFVRKDVEQRAEKGLTDLGVESLWPTSALEALGLLLRMNAVQAGIARVNWSKFREQRGSHRDGGIFSQIERWNDTGPDARVVQTEPGVNGDFRARLLSSEPGAPRRNMMETFVVETLVRVLGRKDAQVRNDRPFGDYGLDSLMAVELRNRCETALGIKLPATVAWNYSTVADLSEHLSTRLGVPLGATSGGQQSELVVRSDPRDFVEPSERSPDQIMESVNRLSDQEALERLLQKT